MMQASSQPAVARRRALGLLVAGLAGCGPADPDRFPDTGKVLVEARDGAGRPVAGVVAELRTPDLALVWRSGTTASDGRVEIGRSDGGVLPGDYALTVVPPAGYWLAPGQPASTAVTVQSHQTSSLTITLNAG